MKRLIAVSLALAAGSALAQSVALQGMLGTKALLIVDGAPPKTVAPGETHKGVKVVSTQGEQAVVEIGGKRHTLRVGDAPASIGGGGSGPRGNKIVLSAGSGGHFFTAGAINGRPVQFVVDTGATSVALSVQDAGARLFDLMLATASGASSLSEVHGLGDNEFVPWQLGAVM